MKYTNMFYHHLIRKKIALIMGQLDVEGKINGQKYLYRIKFKIEFEFREFRFG